MTEPRSFAPTWYPYEGRASAPIPGCPSFVTLSALGKYSVITLTGMRRLHDAVLRKKRIAGTFPWWPDERPRDTQFRYLLAMGLAADGDLRALAQLHAQVNRGIHLRTAALFEMVGVWANEESLRISEIGIALYLSMVEDGPRIASGLHTMVTEEGWVEANAVELGDWLAKKYPGIVEGSGATFRFCHDVIFGVDASPAALETEAPAVGSPRAEPTKTDAPVAPQAPKPDLQLPGLDEAARLVGFAKGNLDHVRRETDRLLSEGVETLARRSIRPLSAHVLALGRTLRRREALLSGPVEMTERVSALCASLAKLHPQASSAMPDGRWEVPRVAAPAILERMASVLAKGEQVEEVLTNVEHMESLLSVKKGRSRESLARRAAQARSDLDIALIEVHDVVDAFAAELRAVGAPVKVLTADVPEDPLIAMAREVEEARSAEAEARVLLEHAETERDEAEQDRDDAWARIQALQAALEAARKRSPDAVEAIPADVDELADWAEIGLGSHVVVHQRALRETRKTRNVNVPRLHEALVLLRDAYVPMRCGAMTREDYEIALRKARLEETACFANLGSAQAFDEYWVTWQGRRVLLDRHLKWGIGTQMERMLRVYFAWDDASGTVLVGHMPTHLDNWKTN